MSQIEKNNFLEARDHLGHQFMFGDIVAYPVRQSSSMWIGHAVISGFCRQPTWNGNQDSLRIETIPPHGWGNDTPRTSRLYNFRNAFIVNPATLCGNEEWMEKILQVQEHITKKGFKFLGKYYETNKTKR